MADYTAIVEAGSALVDLLRDNLTPEPLGNRELIALCSPHESENNQLTLYLYDIEEESQNMTSGYYQADKNTQRRRPAQFILRYLVTAHSKAPAQLREAGSSCDTTAVFRRFACGGTGTDPFGNGKGAI